MATTQPTADTQIPVERRCYPFARMNETFGRNLLVYTGLIQSLGPVEPVPVTASVFAPPRTLPGYCAYWTGHGWFNSMDLRTMTLDQLKKIAAAALDERFRVNAESLSRGYTDAEKWTWASQEADAKAYQATGMATYLLRALAGANSYTLEELCQRILVKADIYRQRYSDLLALYQATQKKIDLALVPDTLPPLTLDDLHRTLGAV